MVVHSLETMPLSVHRSEPELHQTLLVHIMHKAQEVNINILLCLSITATADERCTQLLSKAQATAEKFRRALSLFEKCHGATAAQKRLSESDITDLGMQLYHNMCRIFYTLTF